MATFKTEFSSHTTVTAVLRDLQEFSASPNVYVAVELSQCRIRPEDFESLESSLRLHHTRISSISFSPRSSDASVSDAPLDAETADIGDAGAFKLCRVLYESPGFSTALQELHLVAMLAFSFRVLQLTDCCTGILWHRKQRNRFHFKGAGQVVSPSCLKFRRE